ncbi:PEP motif putative anchor domain protein [Cyanobacterium aponinum PCC 10605]|uniref:PEP motif putative anchor domain protein n=1 Tax=Cyanobacterium aponinum (strain PCC 10605) TaxID=755178 RepID=K9Z8Y1_CYAAP|nr:PEP motif putative anchor domain protein [Cyanobacterium aponinum PCC 10605]
MRINSIISVSIASSTILLSLLGLSSDKVNALTLAIANTTMCSLSDLDVSIACEGAFAGNNENQDLSGLFNVSNWTQYAKVDGDSGTSNGLTVNGGGTSSTWSLTGIDFNSFDIMAILKGGPTFSAYLLDSAGLNWNTDGILKGNYKPGPGLSHFTIYTSAKTPQPVPEPLTILGTGLALGLGGLFKSKQKQKLEG